MTVAVTAVQLFPVLEFTRRTTRFAEGGPHEIYAFAVEPYRLIEMVWPNIFGTQFDGNTFWADIMQVPGVRPKVWVPSLYVGALTFVLAMSSLTFRKGAPWCVCLSLVVAVSLFGSLGQYTSPIWIARAVAASTDSPMIHEWVSELGEVDPVDATPIRLDRYLRDGDGGFYWWLATALPGFKQFRFPAKLFTLTALGLAALAGFGWDRAAAGRARALTILLLIFLVLSLVLLAGVLLEQETILAAFRRTSNRSLFGPFSPEGGYHAIVRGLGQAALVFGLGLALTLLAKRRPNLAGAAAVIVMTCDLASANARYVLTVPQELFETRPEVLKIIEAAEREKPSSGPYRVHRMAVWNPIGWPEAASKDRVFELVSWEHETIQPKHGINFGVQYTHTLGVAELYDYEWYFNGFPRKVYNEALARTMGIEPGKEVVYYPRRAYDMWNTRYFVVPYWHGGWRDEMRGYASFIFETERIYPEQGRFNNTKAGLEAEKNWIETRDFKVLRNLQELPRAWVVHNARMTRPVTALSRESRSESFQEILHAGDRLWNDATQHVYDPRNVAWFSNDDMSAIRRYLSGERPRASEKVNVTYPDPEHAVLEVTLATAGIVVLADNEYPGWTLTIDDKPAPIYRVNGTMRGSRRRRGTTPPGLFLSAPVVCNRQDGVARRYRSFSDVFDRVHSLARCSIAAVTVMPIFNTLLALFFYR